MSEEWVTRQEAEIERRRRRLGWPLEVEPLPGSRWVVRDDRIPGGSKRRSLERFMRPDREYVFAGPGEGYAHVALATTAQATGSRVTAVVADRAQLWPNTLLAERRGAKLIRCRPGYLTVLQARARDYAAESSDRINIPLGLDMPEFRPNMEAALIEALSRSEVPPEVRSPAQVWCAAGSGALSCCLQAVWPQAEHYAVQVGHELSQEDVGSAHLLVAPEAFSVPAEFPPPFPSMPNYDAKVWRYFREQATEGALFWNVAAPEQPKARPQ